MALITSHILNSISGMSAIGIRTQLFRIDENDTRYQIFDVQTDDEGRISQTVSSDYLNEDCEYELVFYTSEYFSDKNSENLSSMSKVVLRFSIDDVTKRYHMPIMLAPHSYSVWSSH